MSTSADTEDSKLLSPRRNLEEEYLTYEAKVYIWLKSNCKSLSCLSSTSLIGSPLP